MTTNPDSLHRLQSALDALVTALISGEPSEVLAVEPAVAAASEAFRADPRLADGDPRAIRLRLLHARLTLRRCELLGAAVRDLAAAMQPAPVYGRTGQSVLSKAASRSGAEARR